MNLSGVLDGAITLAYAVAGLFFLRFWKRSDEKLFVYFAVAFWVLGIQRLALALTAERFEDDTGFYVIRLIAYLILLTGIWQKNRSTR